MIGLRHIRALWTAGLLILACAQLLHAYGHWEQTFSGDHQGCSHSHSPDPAGDPASPSDPAADHCQCPAVIGAQMTVHLNLTVDATTIAEAGIPEAPVSSIDYPPQLS